MNNPCTECGQEMTKSIRPNHDYSLIGFPVTLENIAYWTCPEGHYEYAIPNIMGLHNLLARMVATRERKLLPGEIRFLRDHLCFTGVELARELGVAPETVSRWESKKRPQPMGSTAEKLLRLMALTSKPLSDYPREAEATTFQVKGGRWSSAA